MKKIYIIHRWDGTPDSDWYSWLNQELDTWKIEVGILKMPNTDTPIINEWVSYLKKVIPNPDKNTYFVGHSIGCQAIMRYLEAMDNVKIGGALFVAGWFNLKSLEDEKVKKIAEPWLKTPINFEKVKNSVGRLNVILSDDDPYDCLDENAKIFKERLNANRVFIEEGADHFIGVKYPRILTDLLDVLGVFTPISK